VHAIIFAHSIPSNNYVIKKLMPEFVLVGYNLNFNDFIS